MLTILGLSFALGFMGPISVFAISNPVTMSATSINSTDATLNASNGDTDAIGHSFWVSTSTIDTSSPTIPAGVYSTIDLGPVASSTSFSALLSSAVGLPAVTASTTYYFVAWSNVAGTWLPGAVLNFTTSASAPVPLSAVNLGTAGNFVALAETAITTTGTTAITGDIGVSPAAASFITGFGLTMDSSNTFSTSALITGKVFAADYTSPTPTNMTTAINDMMTAYTDAAGRTLPDATELGAGNIGGMTLVPGLYKWSTDVTIPTNVTLSGGATDIWIFQIAGDLNIASAKNVILSGGALASNVFWQVGGPTGATLGTYSTFNGNILSAKQVIVQTGATLNGRALAQTQITLDGDEVFLSNTAPTATGPVFIDTNANHNRDVGEPTFTTIQSAVNSATSSDTIQVTAGTYGEHVVIDKPLTLNGANVGISGTSTSRVAESIVDGSDTDAPFRINSDGVTIDGFTVAGGANGGYNSGISAPFGNVTIKNNIITANTIGVFANCTSACLISHNLFDSNNVDGSASPGSGIYVDKSNGLTIDNNEFKGHTLGNPIIIAATAPGDNVNITISNNSLHNNTGASVIYALGINGGTFNGNTIISASDVTGISFSGADKSITITENSITNGQRGIRIEDAGYYPGIATSSLFTINKNTITGNTEFGIGLLNATTTFSGIVDATGNWWGSTTGPTVADNLGGTGDLVLVTGMLASTTEINYVNYGAFCSSGLCAIPPVLTSVIITPANSSVTVGNNQQFTASTSDQFGSTFATTTTWTSSNTSVATINFSTGLATGVAVGTVTITASSTGSSVFATTTLTITAVPPSPPGDGGRGGGGGNGAPVGLLNVINNVLPNTPASPNALSSTASAAAAQNARFNGQVLGVFAFNFTRGLVIGSRGDDVIELQNRLTAEGVYTGPVSGYFGPLTFNAIKRFQKKYGISQVGIVGPKTRLTLNSDKSRGTVLGVSTSAEEQARIENIRAQLQVALSQLTELQAKLNAMKL